MSLDTHAHSNPHHEHPDVVGSRNRLGVILLIVADVAFALSMVFTYFYLKAQNVNDMWLPAATEENPAITAVSSAGAWKITAVAAVGPDNKPTVSAETDPRTTSLSPTLDGFNFPPIVSF